MKVKVRKNPFSREPFPTPAMDIWVLWKVGKMPGAVFERLMLKHGKEHWLYEPGEHGKHCPSNGQYQGIECRCDECDHYLTCFPDWKDHK